MFQINWPCCFLEEDLKRFFQAGMVNSQTNEMMLIWEVHSITEPLTHPALPHSPQTLSTTNTTTHQNNNCLTHQPNDSLTHQPHDTLTFTHAFSPTIFQRSPLLVSLVSALSGRSARRNSARLVNIRYGSLVPRVVRSSIRTPMYASVRSSVKADLSSAFRAALIPAMMPFEETGRRVLDN